MKRIPLSKQQIVGAYFFFADRAYHDEVYYAPISVSNEGFSVILPGEGQKFFSFSQLAKSDKIVYSKNLVDWLPVYNIPRKVKAAVKKKNRHNANRRSNK